MYYYAMVLRKTTPVQTVESAHMVIQRYYKYLRYFQKLYPSAHVSPTLETKPRGRGHNVHLHAMIRSPDPILHYPSERGLHIYFETVQSKLAWNAYCAKDNTDEQTILDLIQAYNDSNLGATQDSMPLIYKAINLFSLKDRLAK